MSVEDDLDRPALMARVVTAELATTILLAGELDVAGIDTLRNCVDEVLAARSEQLVLVDAIALHFIDVVGARALILACDRLENRCRLEVSWLQPQVRQALSLADAPPLVELDRPDDIGVRGKSHSGSMRRRVLRKTRRSRHSPSA